MEQQVLQLLADSQSPTSTVRKPAELQLLNLYSDESFPLALTSIASCSSDSVSTALRQSALLVLRSFVVAAWSPHLEEFKGRVLINDANKAHLRRVLLELATTSDVADRKVKASASYVVSKIASADFPEQWPDLLPTLLHIIPNSGEAQLHGALRVLLDLVEGGFSEDQFFAVARELVSTVFEVATNEARKPILRALAVSVFRACFDTFEMVLEQHKAAVKQFMDEALNGWSPFFIATIKAPLPTPPSEDEESKEVPVADQWRGVVALKLQVVKVWSLMYIFVYLFVELNAHPFLPLLRPLLTILDPHENSKRLPRSTHSSEHDSPQRRLD